MDTDTQWLNDLGSGDAVKMCADGHGGSREKTYVSRRTPSGRIVIGAAQFDGATGRERGGYHYLLPWTAHDERRVSRPEHVPPHCLELSSEDAD